MRCRVVSIAFPAGEAGAESHFDSRPGVSFCVPARFATPLLGRSAVEVWYHRSLGVATTELVRNVAVWGLGQVEDQRGGVTGLWFSSLDSRRGSHVSDLPWCWRETRVGGYIKLSCQIPWLGGALSGQFARVYPRVVTSTVWDTRSAHFGWGLWNKRILSFDRYDLRHFMASAGGYRSGCPSSHWGDRLNSYPLLRARKDWKGAVFGACFLTRKFAFWNFLNHYAVSYLELLVGGPVSLVFLRSQVRENWLYSWLWRWVRRGQQLHTVLGGAHGVVFGLWLLTTSFRDKDPVLLGQWVIRVLARLPYRLQRNFFAFLRKFIYESDHYLRRFCGLNGCWAVMKGKIGRAGSVRKQKMVIRWGRCRPTSYSAGVRAVFHHVFTPTGVLGVRIWFVH